MDSRQRKASRIHRVGSREFLVHQEYDSLLGEYHSVYPDFDEKPEYTDEGRPFKLAMDEGCLSHQSSHSETGELQEWENYSDCGSCYFFHRDETPFDLIGVCMCDALQKKSKE